MAGMSGWYYLLLGGLLEIVWAISAKARPWWTLPVRLEQEQEACPACTLP